MVNNYALKQAALSLESDLAGEFPIYIYWSQCQSLMLYSTSLVALLNDNRVPKPLKVSNEGVSFLLQSGVVPPPKTAYENIYILGVGDKADISTLNNKIYINFSHHFPFSHSGRTLDSGFKPDDNVILEKLAEAAVSRVDHSKPCFLFHSAGKDSNTIALALAEAGWQDQVTLVTHKSKGKADESEISARIAKRLGFKHKTLHEVDELTSAHKSDIDNYFLMAPFPSTDNVTLAYPLYLQQMPELKGANLIDGGGNDIYMGLPPSIRDCRIMPLSRLTQHASFVRRCVRSESLISLLVRTPAEWCGVSGLSFADTKKLFPAASSVYPYWSRESGLRKNLDLLDFKTSLLAPIVASEMHIRKARNFSDSIGANLVLPFANEAVARYFYSASECYLFDRKKLRNKVILRDLLKERLKLDSDVIGKKGWSYDSSSITLKNWNWMRQEIIRCSLWDFSSLEKIVSRLRCNVELNRGSAGRSMRLLYRIYLLSAWHNNNCYLN
ncbi:asparagine synthase (glutamine-hydrolysing) [Ectopseudomonas oleovorans]|uniref:Asparagine synthase (Glutamine-hydrolysing) n=1 Tax=Ectopseudomonas oleovorans TaxID=301 RepID=A0A397NSC5_ECTOL|nr:hypothetical protein [Pseudomonas oleovorans]RIA36341.1 asparagine synthase (glutamine-hydrolysing) [Pseudomonas oleovorans]